MIFMNIRQPIITVLGHVDHGKTTLLDSIRQTAIAEREPGQITQSIGASEIPKDVIEKLCGNLLERFNFQINVPGLLFIDTPGHEAFVTLRKRGGSIADLAILVVDINEGLKPQTIECLEILRTEKTPFVVAVNKIDKVQGWKSEKTTDTQMGLSFLENFENQNEITKSVFEEKFYNVISQLSKFYDVDRFDRVFDFKKTIAAVPTSGKTGEGIPELLAVLVGLSQQFLKEQLILTNEAKGSILEVKEMPGLGKTIDVILYDGVLRRGDYIIVSGKIPSISRIKALLLPEPLRDIRVEKKFMGVDECSAACGVKIADNFTDIIAGSMIKGAPTLEEAEKIFSEFEREKEETEIITEKEGLILKADTIGSLEALINIFRNFPVRQALLGAITKQDVLNAELNQDLLNKVVIGFNVSSTEEAKFLAKNKNIRIFESNIIYHLIEDYEQWNDHQKEELKKREIAVVTRPAKITILPGYVFRASNPAIVGCEVFGTAKPGYKLLNIDGREIGEIKQIQKEGETLESVENDKVAISISGPTVGRQIFEGDVLYSNITNDDYKKLKAFEKFLSENEKSILNEIFEIKRKIDSRFGL